MLDTGKERAYYKLWVTSQALIVMTRGRAVGRGGPKDSPWAECAEKSHCTVVRSDNSDHSGTIVITVSK